MGIGTIRATNLDAFVAECDCQGGLGTSATNDFVSAFRFVPATTVDQSLDPFSDRYFEQQAARYREIAGREVEQVDGDRDLKE